ncbi:MAG: Ig-like domain-containing protein [Elusimicrobiota bacterium]
MGTRSYVAGLITPLLLASAMVFAPLAQADWHKGNFLKEWVRYHSTGGEDRPTDVEVDGNGDMVLTGYTPGSGSDYITIKYDTDGNKLWEARYHGGNGSDYAVKLAIDGDNNIYVAGYSAGSGSGNDYLTIKYDPDGNQVWEARTDGPSGGDDTAADMYRDAAGNIYVTGSTHDGTSWNYFTVKYAADGAEQWTAVYDGGSGNDHGVGVVADESGNVYVTGRSNGTGDDFLTVKYDADGNHQWDRRWNGPQNISDWPVGIGLDNDGNVYAAGTGGVRNNGWGHYDYVVVKYDPDGNGLWMTYYHDSKGVGTDQAQAMTTDTEGNVYITGFSWRYSGADDYVTVKWRPDGSRAWVSIYSGMGENDRGYVIAVSSAGYVAVSGRSPTGRDRWDMGTLKLNPSNGTRLWEARYLTYMNYGGGRATAIAIDAEGSIYVVASEYGDMLIVKYAEVPPNSPPVANADNYAVDEDQTLEAAAPGVLGNDTDPDGNALKAILVSGASRGTLALNQDGSFGYTPGPDFNGADGFTYKANDGTVDSNVATVAITVSAVNDPPVADDQAVTTPEDTPVAVTLTASDVETSALTYAIGSGPSHGSLSGAPPNVVYTPDPDYNGPDSFTFTANDGTADSNAATVAITVTPVNDAPTADDQAVTTPEDTAVAITLTASDIDGDPLTYAIGSGPSHGGLSGTPPSVTYTPDPDYNGPDSFTFTANDGTADSNAATVAITVTSVNDDPVAEAGPDAEVLVHIPLGFDGSGSSDIDGIIEAYTWDFGDGSPADAGASPSHTYQEAGVYTVTLTVTDDEGGTGQDALTVTVQAPEEALADSVEAIEAIDLPAGTKNELTSKLESAAKSVEKDNAKSAINQLEAFENAVNAQKGKKLSEEEADALLDALEDIKASIEAGL